jgi:hypothetical protein
VAAPNDVPNLWMHVDPALQFEDPTLGPLLAYWQSKCRDGGLPSRHDIDPVELKEHLGNLCLVEVLGPPLRLRYRLVGTNITRLMHRDATGRCFDELYPAEALPSYLAAYEQLIATRQPLRCYGLSTYPDQNLYRYEILNMPLADASGSVNMVIGKLVFHRHRAET